MEVSQKIKRKLSKPINIPNSKPINIPKSNTNNFQDMYSDFEISSIPSVPSGTPIPLTTNMLKYSNNPFKPNTPVEPSPKLSILYKQEYMDTYADASLLSSKTIS